MATKERQFWAVVDLTEQELMLALTVANMRHIASRRRGLKNAHGFDGRGEFEVDALGAQAEMALAKWTRTYWSASVDTFHGADLGDRVQVRATTYRDGHLLIRQCDPIDHTYVLVVRLSPFQFRIAGQIEGREARRAEFLSQPDQSRVPVWAVPQSALHPVGRR